MKKKYAVVLFALALVVGFVGYNTYDRATSPQFVPDKKITDNIHYTTVVLAGGCFWCTESEFNHLPGVVSAISGYADSEKVNPSYSEVGSEKVKAREAVQVIYNPDLIDIHTLLEVYWKHIDPTDTGGQFGDRGHQYTTAIYYTNNIQKKEAEELKQKINVT